MESGMWSEMLDVLKDISSYLGKAEPGIELEETSLEDRPKIGESQAKKDPIKEGNDPNGKPGEDVVVKAVAEDKDDDDKKDGKKDSDSESDSGSDSGSDSDDVEELKSLLKDIKMALMSKSETIVKSADIKKAVEESVKSSMPGEMQKMLRKMGFQPTRPDVMKIGVDEDVKKDLDASVDIKKAEEAVDKLSSMSWQQLARLREQSGGFQAFPR